MFLPLYDGVALKYVRQAAATMGLLGLTALLYILVSAGAFGPEERIDLALGLVPSVLAGKAVIGPEIALVPAWATPLTSIFLHGSLWHLAGNMLFLWVFGDNVEDAMGTMSFLGFYLLSGILSGLTYAVFNLESQSPLIGASGAISGVAAAYVLLYPRARVTGLLFNFLPIRMPALAIIGAWIAYQVAGALVIANSQTGWWAHAGGILAGALLLGLFKRRETPFLGPRTE